MTQEQIDMFNALCCENDGNTGCVPVFTADVISWPFNIVYGDIAEDPYLIGTIPLGGTPPFRLIEFDLPSPCLAIVNGNMIYLWLDRRTYRGPMPMGEVEGSVTVGNCVASQGVINVTLNFS